MKKEEKFQQYKDRLNGTSIKDLKEFNVCKILYCDIWNMFGLSDLGMLKRICAQIICKPLSIHKMSDHSEDTTNIAVEIQIAGQKREDNDKIFNNLYEYLSPAKHFKIRKKYKFDIMGLIPRLIRLLKYSKSLKSIRRIEKMYLTAQLVMITDLVVLLENEINWENVHFMLIFQEHDTISSTIIQYAQNKGIKVISPQHGTPLNRHENLDQLFFDGFLCDYKLVWNEFTKNQFLSAGLPKERFFVVGNTKMLHESETLNTNSPEKNPVLLGADLPSAANIQKDAPLYYGVLLDCPVNDGAEEYNRKLLLIATALAETTGMSFFIKLHPVDSIDRYKEIIDLKWAKPLPVGVTMPEYERKVLFSLAHVTSAIFDLIHDGCFVFQYITEERYPVEIDDIYKFSAYEELLDHFTQWKTDYAIYKKEYANTVAKYRVTNAKERHDKFFQQLFAGELNV